MYILAKTLTIEGWHLMLTGIGTCIVVSGFVLNLNRARKKEFDKAMDKKADAKTVDIRFENIYKDVHNKFDNVSKRIEDQEKLSNAQFKYFDKIIEEQRTTLEYITNRVDTILITVKKK